MKNEQIIKDTEFYTQYINAIGQETYFDKIEQKHFSRPHISPICLVKNLWTLPKKPTTILNGKHKSQTDEASIAETPSGVFDKQHNYAKANLRLPQRESCGGNQARG